MNQYVVTYYVKKGHRGGREHEEKRIIAADTAKEACKRLKNLCREVFGYNAFRPTAKRLKESPGGCDRPGEASER